MNSCSPISRAEWPCGGQAGHVPFPIGERRRAPGGGRQPAAPGAQAREPSSTSARRQRRRRRRRSVGGRPQRLDGDGRDRRWRGRRGRGPGRLEAPRPDRSSAAASPLGRRRPVASRRGSSSPSPAPARRPVAAESGAEAISARPATASSSARPAARSSSARSTSPGRARPKASIAIESAGEPLHAGGGGLGRAALRPEEHPLGVVVVLAVEAPVPAAVGVARIWPGSRRASPMFPISAAAMADHRQTPGPAAAETRRWPDRRCAGSSSRARRKSPTIKMKICSPAERDRAPTPPPPRPSRTTGVRLVESPVDRQRPPVVEEPSMRRYASPWARACAIRSSCQGPAVLESAADHRG